MTTVHPYSFLYILIYLNDRSHSERSQSDPFNTIQTSLRSLAPELTFMAASRKRFCSVQEFIHCLVSCWKLKDLVSLNPIITIFYLKSLLNSINCHESVKSSYKLFNRVRIDEESFTHLQYLPSTHWLIWSCLRRFCKITHLKYLQITQNTLN